jgi:hypothetical protein
LQIGPKLLAAKLHDYTKPDSATRIIPIDRFCHVARVMLGPDLLGPEPPQQPRAQRKVDNAVRHYKPAVPRYIEPATEQPQQVPPAIEPPTQPRVIIQQ